MFFFPCCVKRPVAVDLSLLPQQGEMADPAPPQKNGPSVQRAKTRTKLSYKLQHLTPLQVALLWMSRGDKIFCTEVDTHGCENW